MRLNGTVADLEKLLSEANPEAAKAEQVAARLAKGSAKQRVRKYQAYALYCLAQIFDTPGANVLEIGTYYGYTAAILAQAMPQAQVVTLNVLPWEVAAARDNLKEFGNVQAYYAISWERLKDYCGPQLDLLFIDGDHRNIEQDLPWYNWLRSGGLLICHDYSPEGAVVACPPVYRGLEQMKEQLGREFDVLVIDDQRVGMAGYYRREGENYVTNIGSST